MAPDSFETLARLSAEAFRNGLWQGLLLTFLIWLGLRLAPRSSRGHTLRPVGLARGLATACRNVRRAEAQQNLIQELLHETADLYSFRPADSGLRVT